jgi:hypothetical protein
MQHFKIDTEAKGWQVSELIYKVMHPNGGAETKYLFLVNTDSTGQAYISLDTDMQCPIFLKPDFDSILHDIAVLLNVPDSEGAKIKQLLETGQITIAQIITSVLEEFTPKNNKINFINGN